LAALIAVLKTQQPEVRVAAVHALGAIGNQWAIAALREARRQRNRAVKKAVYEVLAAVEEVAAAVSAVTENLKRQGSAFEVLPHRQASSSIDEARALGIDAGEVLKPLAMRTGSGYALMVIPASRRLDLQLARAALADNQARLATEDELGRDFAGYDLGALPPLGALLGAKVYVDPEVLGHDTVAFAAGTQTESIKMRTEDLFKDEWATTVPLVKHPERVNDDPVA
jgi:Ala-tRNA(Pro) deacylase